MFLLFPKKMPELHLLVNHIQNQRESRIEKLLLLVEKPYLGRIIATKRAKRAITMLS